MKRVVDIFREIDEDGSGEVDRYEFRRGLRIILQSPPQTQTQQTQQTQQTKQQTQQTKQQTQQAKQQTQQAKQQTQVQHPSGRPNEYSDAQLDALFDAVDESGDGKISYRELTRTLRSQPAKGGVAPHALFRAAAAPSTAAAPSAAPSAKITPDKVTATSVAGSPPQPAQLRVPPAAGGWAAVKAVAAASTAVTRLNGDVAIHRRVQREVMQLHADWCAQHHDGVCR